MMIPMNLQDRVDAAQATLDQVVGRTYEPGKRDCAQMVKAHLRRMGRPVRLAGVGTYNSLLGAKRALKRFGYDRLDQAMDDHFPRIAPAAALVGDIVALTADADPGALFVVVGNGRVVGYHESTDQGVVMQPSEYESAWRIEGLRPPRVPSAILSPGEGEG